jgi:hypothetical protein
MNKIFPPKFNRASAMNYLKREKILKLINTLDSKKNNRMQPDVIDLARIHKLIRNYKIFTALEFGIGYSTIVISDALKKNADDYNSVKNKKIVEKNNKFELHSVDSSKKWINNFKKDFNNIIYKNTSIYFSSVYLSKYNDQICSLYKKIPPILPDFIYLDAPDPNTIKNKINNIDYNNSDFVVMSGDILTFENFLLPGCIILVDGRNTNLRFLKNNLRRKWSIIEDYKSSYSFLYLNELPIGKKNLNYLEYRFNEKI